MVSIKQLGFALFLLASKFSGFAQTSNKAAEDSLGIIVTQNSTYIMPGQWLEINVFSRCNTANGISKVLIGGSSIPVRKDGIATFGTMGNAIGHHKIPVQVSFINRERELTYKKDTVEYTVGQANFSIALDRMNILYTGIDNPISVAASGGGDDKVNVSIEGGDGVILKVGPGKYNVKVRSVTDECIIYVYIEDKLIGASRFRVRNLPAPDGTVGGYTSGDSVAAGAFKAQQGVGAYLKNSPFDMSYEVTGYTLNIYSETGEIRSANCKGSYFSDEAKKIIKEYLAPGKIVTVGSLFVKDAGGKNIKLAPLIYHIK